MSQHYDEDEQSHALYRFTQAEARTLRIRQARRFYFTLAIVAGIAYGIRLALYSGVTR
jgi:hypothetical protein